MSHIVYVCPILPSGHCNWEGDRSEVFSHCKEKHADSLFESNLVSVDIINEPEKHSLMSYNGEVYLIQSNYKDEKLQLILRYLGSYLHASSLNYYVEVLAGKFAYTNLDESGCYHPVKNVGSIIEIDVDILKMTGGIQDIITFRVHFEKRGRSISRHLSRKRSDAHRIAIRRKNTDRNTTVTRNSSFTLQQICPNESYFNDEFENKLQLIMCSTCAEYMTAPIYMCTMGHSVCFQCQTKKCSVCNNAITDFRNSDLEEESKKATHPCRYLMNGCKKLFIGGLIREHEIICNYANYSCPSCHWNGRYIETEKHFRIVHPSVKLIHDLEHSFLADTKVVIINSSGVFLCTSEVINSWIDWTVVFCGTKETCFLCTVNVVGKKDNYKTYVLKRNGNEYKLRVATSELKAIKVRSCTLKIHTYFN